MLILYITYIDFGVTTSGSSVRPQKMYKAFIDEGHQVKLLSGGQGNLRTRYTRIDAVAEITRWLDGNRPDLCYIESPVYPIMWAADRKLIRRVHRMGVPIGYFYRDFYWKFPELYPRRKDLTGALKERFLDLQQNRTDALLRCADIVYFPSREAGEFFPFRDKRALPPAGENGNPIGPGEANTSIYVGGLSGDYGGEALYITDEAGSVLAGPLSYRAVGDGILTPEEKHDTNPDGHGKHSATRMCAAGNHTDHIRKTRRTTIHNHRRAIRRHYTPRPDSGRGGRRQRGKAS